MDEKLQAIKERLAAFESDEGPLQDQQRAVDEFDEHAPSDIAYLLDLVELAQRARDVQHKVNW